jgi:hypothetical protein
MYPITYGFDIDLGCEVSFKRVYIFGNYHIKITEFELIKIRGHFFYMTYTPEYAVFDTR